MLACLFGQLVKVIAQIILLCLDFGRKRFSEAFAVHYDEALLHLRLDVLDNIVLPVLPLLELLSDLIHLRFRAFEFSELELLLEDVDWMAL